MRLDLKRVACIAGSSEGSTVRAVRMRHGIINGGTCPLPSRFVYSLAVRIDRDRWEGEGNRRVCGPSRTPNNHWQMPLLGWQPPTSPSSTIVFSTRFSTVKSASGIAARISDNLKKSPHHCAIFTKRNWQVYTATMFRNYIRKRHRDCPNVT